MMWYKDSIGIEKEIVATHEDAYWVRDNMGYLNIVKIEDAEEIGD